MSSDLEDRYQNQSWYVKLWRMRYYVPVPFASISFWIKSNESFDVVWSICVGMAQSKMEYWYTLEEIKERLEIDGY